jgi:hypothetical protein
MTQVLIRPTFRNHNARLLRLAALLLFVPMVVQLVAPDRLPAAEAASLTPAPAWPHSMAELAALPAATGAYLQDHFGLRKTLIAANGVVQSLLLHSGNDRVLMGRDGQLFLRDDNMVEQSTGRLRRADEIAATADLLAALDGRLRAKNIPFLVAPAPNAATIYPELLPRWAAPLPEPTEATLLLAELVARGVRTLDLRPLLMADKARGRIFRRLDSHWTNFAALLAFNHVTQAMGMAEWSLSPVSSLGAEVVLHDGDLARLLGLEALLSERMRSFALSVAPNFAFRWIATSPLAYEIDMRRSGPTILVIGDSFTGEYFRLLLMQRAGRIVWMENQHCRFDQQLLLRSRPDQVWYMPTERLILCGGETIHG